MFLKLINRLSFEWHLAIGFSIRLLIIMCGEWIDTFAEVPFTDIDYRVVTDGARHILHNDSPYKRHTYRYSPALAMLCTPNHLLHGAFGKVLFVTFDCLVAILIRGLVHSEYECIWRHNSEVVMVRAQPLTKQQRHTTRPAELRMPAKYDDHAKWAALAWLYNPLAIAISTRGNSDSIASVLVLFTLYFLLQPTHSCRQYFYAGLVHGLAVHFRLYPAVFSLTYFMYASGAGCRNLVTAIFEPNQRQLSLVCGTIVSVAAATVTFYQQYGYEFLYETYIYHFQRRDTRHNFSLYFYMQYLGAGDGPATISPVEKWFQLGPQVVILALIAVRFGRHAKTLPFAVFLQAFTMVTFNPVVTAQYFIWFLAVLPLCLKNLQRIGRRTAIVYALLWLLTQGAWLIPAYLLEFKGWNTFSLIWMQSVMFFCANMFIMQRLIVNFNVIADFRHKDL